MYQQPAGADRDDCSIIVLIFDHYVAYRRYYKQLPTT